MEGYEFTALHDCEHATRVDYSLSTGKEDGIFFQLEEPKEYGVKAERIAD